MTIDSYLAAALLTMFLGWHVIILLVILFYLARGFIEERIHIIERTEQREADIEITRLSAWAEKSLAAKAGLLAYDIGRCAGLGAWREVVKASDMVEIMGWGLVMLWEYRDH